LRRGCDIIICGRVADASPVIGAAWYWWGWGEEQYDELAGALVAGHLIECSAYVTGSNFSGFDEYELDRFVDLSYGIAELDKDGTAVITKHDGTNGLVNVDNVKCQFLYELQGSVYLNSDVTAVTDQIKIEQTGKDRVKLSNVKGFPPPPTTKLAIFYQGGYESQFLLNATGYATTEKYALFEKQLRHALKQKGLLDKFQLLDFQVLGTPAPNPRSQFSSTTYLRLFAQADTEAPLYGMLKTWSEIGMQHFSGFHRDKSDPLANVHLLTLTVSLDTRTALPRPYLAFYPALYPQDSIKEGIAILSADGKDVERYLASRPSKYQKLDARENYDTAHPIDLASLGPTKKVRLGDVCLARSGDKGANINFGIFVRSPEHYPWLQTFMSRAKLQELMGDDWESDFFVERMEFPNLQAVHFVIYGPLGRGVSSCRLLDALGKGFADYIRDKVVDVPERILADMEGIKQDRRSRL
jgi:Acyclic terpene utilisation family protein AtuA